MVTDGEVVSDHPEVTYGRGDYFGEVELFKSQRTVSTFLAKGAVTMVVMTREHFMAHVPLTGFVSETKVRSLGGAGDDLDEEGGGLKPRSRRFGQAAEATTGVLADTPDSQAPATRKSDATRARIKRAVKSHMLFNRLEPAQFDMLVDHMTEHSVPAGTVVIREGEKGNHFYVVDQGECDAYSSAVTANGGLVKSFRQFDSFGELALMYNCPRTATISTRTDSVLWSLDRASFRRVLLEENARKAKLYDEFLENVPLLTPLSKTQRNRMVDALDPLSVAQGEEIIAQGAEGTHFFVIESGEVHVSNRENGHLATRGPGDYFGEVALRTGAPTNATVKAHSACKLVRMDRGAFQRLLGPVDSLLKMRRYNSAGKELDADCIDDSGAQGVGGAETAAIVARKKRLPMLLADFEVSRKILGEGAFGKVRRAHHKASGEMYAIKEMAKHEILSSGQVEHILQESEVLDDLNSPYIANKITAFQTSSHLYILTEFAPGGDLYDKLQAARQFSTHDARVYISQVLLALEHIHSKGYVHRDLKLENLLITHDGAVKLTDFGFAKKVLYRTWTLCGTPEYLAPEIVLEKGHNKAADYWALGVLLFEFLSGRSPFEAEDHMATYKKILTGKPNYPKRLEPQGVELITCLLQRDITRRFGNLKDGTADIKKHVFFSGFDWDKAKEMRGSFHMEPVSVSKFSDWARAEDVCVIGKNLTDEEDSAFATFGK